MRISEQTWETPQVEIARSGDSVDVSLYFQLYGYYLPHLGEFRYNGYATVKIDEESWGASQDWVDDYRLDIDFSFELIPATTYECSYHVTDYDAFVFLDVDFKLTIFSQAASFTGSGEMDVVFGSNEADTLFGEAGSDFMDGGGENDRIEGGIGLDTVDGGAGHDTLLGGSGHDTLGGQSGADWLLGGNSNDILNGGSSGDTLEGGNGDDVLSGGTGNDILIGGRGKDVVTGGSGADTFVFVAVTDSGMHSTLRDTIAAFGRAYGDKISVALIDADVTASGNGAFTFIGDDVFSGVAGELRYEIISRNTFVYGDVNGDGAADFSIRINGVNHFVAADFVL